MHIQPQYIPIADLRFTLPSHIDRAPVQEAQVVMATVLSRSDGGLVRLLINDLQVDVQLPLLVQRGQQIPLKLTEANGQQMLEIPPEFLESYNPVAASLRQTLPKQESMQEVLPKLFQLLSKEGWTANLQKAIMQMQAQLPEVEKLFSGDGVKKAVLNSGAFLERKLFEQSKDSQQNARANRNSQYPLPTEAFRQDVKANLLRLLQHLTGLTPNDSKLKAGVLENNQAPFINRNAPPLAKEGASQNQQGAMKENQPDILANFLKTFSLLKAKPEPFKTIAADMQNGNSMVRNLNGGISIQRNLASSSDAENTANPGRNPQALTDELSQALQQLPEVEKLFSGDGVKKAVLNSGAFLERKLFEQSKDSQQNARANRNSQYPLPTEAFRQDVKANLLRLLQHLTGLTPNDSKLKAGVLENNQAPFINRNAPPLAKEGASQNQQGAMKENQPDILANFLKTFSLLKAKPEPFKTIAADMQNGNSMVRNLNGGISIQRNLASSSDAENTANPGRNPQALTDELSQALQQLPQRALASSPSSGNPLGKAILAFIETANLTAMGKAQSQQSPMDHPNDLAWPTKNQIAPDYGGQAPSLKDMPNGPKLVTLANNRNVFLQRNASLDLASSMPKAMATGEGDSSSLVLARQLVEAALGRIELTQLASLPRGNAQHIFTEIVANHPFLWVIPLQIRIDREVKKQTGEMAVPHWSVALTLDLGNLGRMDALVWQEKAAVSASLWTEKPETRTLLRDRLPLLQSFLQEAGIAVANLNLHEGLAPIRADEPHVDANNLVNLFL